MITTRAILGPLGISMVAIAAVLISILWQTGGVFSVFGAPSLEEVDATARIRTIQARHTEQINLDRARFDGRSIFYTPPRPRREVTQPDIEREPVDRGPSPAPASYGGSLKPVAILGSEVWFKANARSEPRILKVGERTQDIELLEIHAPWSVRVRWTRGGHEPGEYDVQLHQTDNSGFLTEQETVRSRMRGFNIVDGATQDTANTDAAEETLETQQDDDTTEENQDAEDANEEEAADERADEANERSRPGPGEDT